MSSCEPNLVSSFLSSPEAVKASYWFPDGESSALGDSADSSCPSSAEKIDATLFTHLFCAFADIEPQTHLVSIMTHWHEFSGFTETVKRSYNKVHTLLSIGGKNADNSAFASMARNPSYRKAFIDSAIEIARNHRFSGLDLAWEYPNNAVDMTNLGTLVQELRKAVKDEADINEKSELLLTAAVFYRPEYNSFPYPVQDFVDNLDWVNVRAFDFYGPGWSKVTGPPAALFDTGKAQGLSGDSGVQQWIKAGLPLDKLVFGLPYVGWAWTLQDDKENGYDAATTGPAISANGSINYDQVKNYIVSNGAATVHNQMVTGDYCYADKTWIAYDDNQSIVKKVAYAKQRTLRGYFSWHVGVDSGCGLSRAASRAWDATEVTTTE